MRLYYKYKSFASDRHQLIIKVNAACSLACVKTIHPMRIYCVSVFFCFFLDKSVHFKTWPLLRVWLHVYQCSYKACLSFPLLFCMQTLWPNPGTVTTSCSHDALPHPHPLPRSPLSSHLSMWRIEVGHDISVDCWVYTEIRVSVVEWMAACLVCYSLICSWPRSHIEGNYYCV